MRISPLFKKDKLNFLKDIKKEIEIHSDRTKMELLHIEETYDKERVENIKETLKTLEDQNTINNLDNIYLSRNRITI